MTLSIWDLVAVAAVLGAILTLVFHRERVRLFPLIAVASTAVLTLMHFRIVHPVRGNALPFILGALLMVSGGAIWARAGVKLATTGATVVFLYGLLLVLAVMRVVS